MKIVDEEGKRQCAGSKMVCKPSKAKRKGDAAFRGLALTHGR
jgi:hypothetical protein